MVWPLPVRARRKVLLYPATLFKRNNRINRWQIYLERKHLLSTELSRIFTDAENLVNSSELLYADNLLSLLPLPALCFGR